MLCSKITIIIIVIAPLGLQHPILFKLPKLFTNFN